MGEVGGVRRGFREGAIWAVAVLLAVLAPSSSAATLTLEQRPSSSAATLTLEQRLQAQEALDRVAYRHRLWPQGTSRPKPPFEELFPEHVRRRRVEEDLEKSAALASTWQRPIAGSQLQAEIDRMVRNSKAPDVLSELFAALGQDPHLIAECLARPILADRLVRQWYAHDPRFQGERRFEDWLHDRGAADRKAAVDETLSYPYDVPRMPSSVGDDNTWTPMTEVPAERAGHTVVWTGTEMIVWGGSASPGWPSYVLNSGGRYNPATDTWNLTSTVNAPAARTMHSAVWTGAEMIVWGGAGQTYLNTGGRYDPATDTWTATGLPPATIKGRAGHTVVWTGTEMIVWGGSGDVLSTGTTGGRYNPATDTWTATPVSGLSARLDHSAVWTGTEMIVWGGGLLGAFFSDGSRYDPATNAWAGAAAPPGIQPRYRHTAVWTGTEMIVWGGTGTTDYQNGARYDPSTNSWTPTSLAGAPPPSASHAAVWTGAEMIVTAGGRYDPFTNTWTSMSASGAHSAPAAVWTGAEMIVWGGDWAASGRGARYSPASDSWVATATSAAPTPRKFHTAVWTGTEMVVWGGDTNWFAYYNSGGRYSPATDAWTPTATSGAPSGRSRHAAVWTGSAMIVWGGCDGGGGFCEGSGLSTGARYDPVGDVWTPMSALNAPVGRSILTAVWTGAEAIFWGGFDGVTSLDSGGRYDPASDTWTPTSMANAPTGRFEHTAVWTGAEMVVWGGSLANTGGRYDPVADAWTATSLVGAPDGRSAHTAVWSGQDMIVWGGWGASVLGGRYDPATDTWAAMTPSGAPDARSNHAAVWTGAEMIVWAGLQMGTGDPLNSGGRYDPSSDSWSATSTEDAPSHRRFLPAIWTGAQMLAWSGSQQDAPETYTGGRYVPGIVLTPGVLPDGAQAVAYGQPLSASGGTEPYSFQVTAGSLPAGLMLSSAGSLSGVPDAAGAYSFTVTATDATSRTGSRVYSIDVVPDTQPPSASLTFPSGGSTLSGGVVTVTASASDNAGVTQVEFYIDGLLRCTDAIAPYTCGWDVTYHKRLVPHAIYVKAYDAALNVGASPTISVTIDNSVTSDNTPPAPGAALVPRRSGRRGRSVRAPGPPVR